MSLTFERLREANIARQAEWPGVKTRSPILFRAVELGGEVGEALNIVKKLEREQLGYAGSRSTVADLADELADVVICVELLAERYGIDVGDATIRKFNVTSDRMGLETKL